MSTIMNLNTDKARLEPDTVFAHPDELVAQEGLTRGQKIAALERWELTLQDRLRATDEGMAPPAGQTADEAELIEAIAGALKALRDRSDVAPSVPS